MIKQKLLIFSSILALGSLSAIANAQNQIKDADSITKDLIINPGITVPTRSVGTINSRGIKIVPVSADQQNEGTGRTALSVEFNHDSASLTQNARLQLDQLAQALASKNLNEYTFRIIGHTDATGSDEYNMGLSERRAFSVVKYLNDIHRVSGDRLYAAGKGETELADPDNPGSGVNRRVEVRNLGAQ